MLEKNCKLIVIACNTASAAGLKRLRELYPDVPFVGMEPAVKTAAEQTQSGIVGVLATTATFQGELFASVIERFAQHVRVLRQPCPGLVQQIEAGKLDTPDTERMLRDWVEPMLKEGIDRLVLGCTHYPFVKPLLEKICGTQVTIIDPAPAVARQIQRILTQHDLLTENAEKGKLTSYTTSSRDSFIKAVKNIGIDAGEIIALGKL